MISMYGQNKTKPTKPSRRKELASLHGKNLFYRPPFPLVWLTQDIMGREWKSSC